MAANTEIPIVERETAASASSATRISVRENEISLLDILIVLAQRKWLILKVTAIVGIAGLLISLILPKQFTAVTTVLPPQQNSSMGSMLASQLGGSLGAMAALTGAGSSFLKNPNDMYASMLKSQTVEDSMIRRFGLMQEYKTKLMSTTRKAFESHFSVESNSKDGLLRLSVEDRDPKRAADMANGWVDQFRKLSQSLAISEAAQRRLFFEQQLALAKDNLANAEEALKRTEQTTGMIQLDSQARALIESAAMLRAQIAAKEVQLQGIHTYATNENSNVVQLQQELDSLRAQLAKLGGSEDNTNAGLIMPKGQVTQAGLEYVRKLRDVKYYETIFDILARQFEVAKLDEAKEGALVQVVDPALIPDWKSSPKRALITLAATLVGLIVGMFWALAQALLERMHEDPEMDGKLSSFRQAISLKRTHVM
jgi:tyrosine-protein kinase Etk/Wzc